MDAPADQPELPIVALATTEPEFAKWPWLAGEQR